MITFNIPPVETDAEEAQRLARSPEGSRNHNLSKLPVLTPFIEKGVPLQVVDSEGVMVVVPTVFHGSADNPVDGTHLHTGAWNVVVIYSENSPYSVGGFDLVLPESQLRRSRVVDLRDVLVTS